jgi:hypothetical protein
MSTSLATTERNAFQQYSDAASRSRIIGKLLKFSKGEYLAGQDSEEIAEGTKLVVNMDELMVGWQKWADSKPAESEMGRVAEGFRPPKRADLGDLDEGAWETDDRGQPRDPWQLTNVAILKDVDGDQVYTFATSRKGGVSAIGELAGAYGKAMRQRPDEYPIVALNVRSYKHPNKNYGKIFTPKFDIVGWAPKSSFDGALNAASTEAAEEEVPF